MHATIRTYAGNHQLADALAARLGDVEPIMSAIPGFNAYHVIRTDEGTVTVTVCDDEAGCAESARRAADYLREHAADLPTSPPTVQSGKVLIGLG
jgi:hypothetical protein